jgi:GDPmannose 4,6-dehydratase|tara:strand:- start:163 stop:333 length:171 start_codon:yes stop_codon:yes gene_type:complete
MIAVDPINYRSTEVEELVGDASKAKQKLGWKPKMTFEELVKVMVQADWEKVKRKGY